MLPSSVVQTCWIWFSMGDEEINNRKNDRHKQKATEREGEGTERQKCLCKKDSNCLTLFMDSGAIHYIPLPFMVIYSFFALSHQIHYAYWEIKCRHLSCLSMQVRQVTPLSVGLLIERDTTGEESGGGLPTFFSLLHPMNDICPVSIKRPSVSKFHNSS